MPKKIINFIKYNNTLPILFGVIFLGATGALAANEDVRGAVVSSDQVIRSIDNTRIVNVDLNTFKVSIEITGVEEDDENYYVSYTLNTIEIHDSVWSDVGREIVLVVPKDLIVGRDLGIYASEELAEVRNHEQNKLAEAQQIERSNGISTKAVATVYSGLVGRFLDEKEESFPGYQPVVVPKWEPSQEAPQTTPTQITQPTPTDTSVVVGDPSDTEAPVVAVLGNNPARIKIRSTYSDLGAYVTDNISNNIGYKIFVDGVETSIVNIDTSTTTTYTITYKAIDQVGNSGEATRIVEVYDPSIIVKTPESTATTTASTATNTPSTEPEPVVEEPTPPVEESTATTTPITIEVPVVDTPPVVEEPIATTTPETIVDTPIVEEPIVSTSTPSVVEAAVSSSTPQIIDTSTTTPSI